ncbi:flagellar filament capping protein FliD [Hydrogenophaga sp. T2]|uniref:flagellar filament capping protein FliD n=1 Tax=Hydrogenophaga sp. T2 TaxID=3132823 RepID=UPI003CF337F7
MAISSPGIGTGLDVQSIVSQLVAIERKPLETLQTQATSLKTQLSTYGTIKSQFAALGDAAAKLSTTSGWGLFTASSSDNTSISVTAGTGATGGSFTMEVQQLARAQSTASTPVTTGSTVGTGTLSIEIGSWSGTAFTSNGKAAVPVSVSATDTLSSIATKINQAGAGVTATVLRDANGERLLMRSSETGETQAFRVQASGDAGVQALGYDPGGTGGATLTQAAQNALAKVNGVDIVSASNKLSDTLTGLNITLNQTTLAPVEIRVTPDTEALKKQMQAFVDAYNTLNDTLSNAVKYDDATKTAGPLQGDSTTVGLQNALRAMMRSVSGTTPFSRLLDVGISTQQTGGKLTLDTKKFDEVMAKDLQGVQRLFTATNTDATLRGFGLKVKAFTDGMLATDGKITSRTEAIQKQQTRNTQEQDRINERADRAQTRLLAQFSALDTTVAQYNTLGSFVSQQLSLWSAG